MAQHSVSATVEVRIVFAERLKKMRLELGLRQVDVEEVLGKRPGWGVCARWEQGLRLPNYADLVRLADVFGVTTDYLLGRTP